MVPVLGIDSDQRIEKNLDCMDTFHIYIDIASFAETPLCKNLI